MTREIDDFDLRFIMIHDDDQTYDIESEMLIRMVGLLIAEDTLDIFSEKAQEIDDEELFNNIELSKNLNNSALKYYKDIIKSKNKEDFKKVKELLNTLKDKLC